MTYIFANWKMYLDFDESMILTNQLLSHELPGDVRLGIFPSTLAVSEAQKALVGSHITLGAQDVFWTPTGAYTGAVSAEQYKSVGCSYALVGHSERRHVFGDTNDNIRKRLDACLDAGLKPILCIGETAEDRKDGRTHYRLKKQLMKALDGLASYDDLIIAYEPVWAISKAGEGTPCLASDAEDVHGWIKQEITTYTDKVVPVIYGGSVNEENIKEYLTQASIDGVLVGSASTSYDKFAALLNNIPTA